MSEYDVVIVGGAAMGSATAYYLGLLDPSLSVAVVEMDSSYEFSSTLRSEGNLRVQFNLEENIRMSMFTMRLLDSFADDMEIDGWRPDPAPRRQGNLFLIDDAGVGLAQAGLDLQVALGCDVEWLEPNDIAIRWPALRAQGIVGATFGPADGFIDPSAVLHGLRRNAIKLGAHYIEAQVTAIDTDGDRVAGVTLADGSRLSSAAVVNCAGGWSKALAATAGIHIPVEPVMRKVYLVDSQLVASQLPNVFLPSGVYAIPEGDSSFEMGWSRPSDPVGFDFTFSRAGFEESIWPELVATLPAFDELAVTGGWRGLYAMNTLDNNAILGEWPTLGAYFNASGFSGHGFQHTPAMGRYLAELITDSPISLDLSRLGPQRIIDGIPLSENAGRII